MDSNRHRPVPPITAEDLAKATAGAGRLLAGLLGSAARKVIKSGGNE